MQILSRDHKIPLSIWLQKWIELGNISPIAIFLLSSPNFGEVAMSSNMVTPYKTLILEILKFLSYTYFAKIVTRKPNIGNLTKVMELYPFLKSKKWYLLFKHEGAV